MLNKGKIIHAKRVDMSSQVIINVGLTVTAEMMPSFRFVAFYRIPWQRREEVVSDSIWVDVVDICPGAVSSVRGEKAELFQKRKKCDRQCWICI